MPRITTLPILNVLRLVSPLALGLFVLAASSAALAQDRHDESEAEDKESEKQDSEDDKEESDEEDSDKKDSDKKDDKKDSKDDKKSGEESEDDSEKDSKKDSKKSKKKGEKSLPDLIPEPENSDAPPLPEPDEGEVTACQLGGKGSLPPALGLATLVLLLSRRTRNNSSGPIPR